MQRARHQGAGDAHLRQMRQIGFIAHPTGRIERPTGASRAQRLQRLKIRPRAGADPGQRHGDDPRGPQLWLPVNAARVHGSVRIMIEGEHHIRPGQKGTRLGGIRQTLRAHHAGAQARLGPRGGLRHAARARIHPQLQLGERGPKRTNHMVMSTLPGDGVEVGHIERAERHQGEKGRYHIHRQAAGHQRRNDGPVGCAVSTPGVHNLSSPKVHDRDKLHEVRSVAVGWEGDPMRVFICEYVTSGGVRDKPLPETMLPEGTLIRDALVTDLEELPGVSTILAHDDRLPPPTEDSVPVRKGADPWITWSGLAQEADVVWPIGPETGGVFARMVRLMKESADRLIAPTPAAIDLATSKFRTAQILASHDIPHVPTYPLDNVPASLKGDLITKPDDGAGVENTRAWPGREALPRSGRLVVQPFIHGMPASLTVLVRPDGVTLLSANQLHISHLVGVITPTGVTVGGVPDEEGALSALAQRVVAAFPGLSGIVGIDLILAKDGPVVVEVNPRVTTAYAGLHASLGINPAAFLPELIRDGRPPALPHLPRPSPVEVKIR